MCGLVGMAGDIRESHKKMFRDMLVFDQVRGFDSTGIAIVRNAYATITLPIVEVIKDLGAAQNLWECDTGNKFKGRGILNAFPKALIGHNRAATIGKVTVDNAHPFTYGDITGAHNGSLIYWKDLVDSDDFDVDSKALFNHINEKGIDDCWKTFYGAAALTYYNEEDDTINLIRNDERPLCVIWSADGKTLFWASEQWMIMVAANRHKVELAKSSSGKVLATELTPDRLYTYKVTSSNCELVEERDLEKKSWTFQKSPNSGKSTSSNVTVNVQRGGSANFKPNRRWKRGTKRSSFVTGNYTLADPRWEGSDSLFRVRVIRDAALLGFLDIFPNNRREYDTLNRAAAKTIGIPKIRYSLKLRGSPRLNSQPLYDTYPRWMCSASLVKVNAFMAEEEKEEKKTADTNIVPSKQEDSIPFEEGDQENLYEDALVPGPNGLITVRALNKLLSAAGSSCSWCGTVVDAMDANELYWIDKQTCVCEECSRYMAGTGYSIV